MDGAGTPVMHWGIMQGGQKSSTNAVRYLKPGAVSVCHLLCISYQGPCQQCCMWSSEPYNQYADDVRQSSYMFKQLLKQMGTHARLVCKSMPAFVTATCLAACMQGLQVGAAFEVVAHGCKCHLTMQACRQL